MKGGIFSNNGLFFHKELLRDKISKANCVLFVEINNQINGNLHTDLDYETLTKKLPKNIVAAYDGISFNF